MSKNEDPQPGKGAAPPEPAAEQIPLAPVGEPEHRVPPNAWPPPPPLAPIRVWPEDVWPLPNKAAAPTRVLAGAVAAGLVAALTLRLDVPGIGFLLTGLAVLAAALATTNRWPRPTQAVAAVATVALLAVGTVRAADWLFALCMVVSLATGSIALVGGRSWRAMFLGVLATPLVQARAWAWSSRGLGRLGAVKGVLVGRIVGVSAVSLLLLLVFGGLFYGADNVFAEYVDAVLPDLAVANVIGNGFLFAIVTGITLTAACLAHLPPAFDKLAENERKPLRRWEWAVPLGLLNVLFAVFVVIQLDVLFGDRHEKMVGPGHRLEYSAYAREGFWQLMTVTILTLGVLALANAKAGRETKGDRALVRGLLGGLSVFSLVIVASALARLARFETEFGFTVPRVFVHAVELWLGLVFVLILIAGVKLSGKWLPRAILGTGVVALLALAAINPDAYIAERNVERFTESGKIDVTYLGTLSADAVPAFLELPEPQRYCVLNHIDVRGVEGEEPERWYTYNVGRARAVDALGGKQVGPKQTCPYDAPDFTR